MAVNNLNPATVPPTAAEIAAAVAAPSAATIAAAVAAPSAATIAAAVAAPSAATIASTVAAPSAATIASTVAASVPTLSQINTSVSSNASPFGGTWTTIYDNRNVTGTTTVTVTGLGSYKYIKVLYHLLLVGGGGGSEIYLRLNGDTGTNYNYNFLKRVNTTAQIDSITQYNSSFIGFNYVSESFANQCTGTLELINPQSGSFKIIEGKHGRSRESNQQGTQYGLNAAWYSNSAVTSLTIFQNQANFGGGQLIVLGAN